MKMDLKNFFKLLLERKINEAEKELSRRRGEGGSEWERGFMKALEGLLLAQKNPNDKYLFLNSEAFTKRELRELKRRFLKHSKDELHAEYDRGYFSCMVEYVKALEKMGPGEG
ncbi:MAG: hypothetical protein QXV45_02355 [Candidatus Bathyarchaeia archaeon]